MEGFGASADGGVFGGDVAIIRRGGVEDVDGGFGGVEGAVGREGGGEEARDFV